MINDIKGSEIIYTYMINELKRWVFGKKSSLSTRKKYNTILEAEGYYESIRARRSVPKSRIKPRNVSREIGSDNWQMELNPLINPIKPVLTLEM
jgi:hypothetical protein